MKAVVFLADGFEECEALIVVDILRRAGVETVMASVMDTLTIDSSRHIKVLADKWFPVDEKRPGRAGTHARGCHKLTDIVYHFFHNNLNL